ncbi:MAG: glycosyltransferase family 4 protein, partial [Candidatus Omnitrophica bacterium]|nr:glycosyltransferase family 4 protein [Candidatus Omnitrophota bacterium]
MSAGKRIAFFTIGHADVPSTRFRVLQYRPWIEKCGAEVDVFTLPRIRGGKFRQAIGLALQALTRWRQLRRCERYDLVIIQKGLTPWRCRGLADRVLKMRTPYFMDIDDGLYLVNHIRLPRWLRWMQDDDETVKLLRGAARNVVGNGVLADFAGSLNPRWTVIPTALDTEKYFPEPCAPRRPLTIGWSGSYSTNFYLNGVIPALRKLSQTHSFKLLIVSDSPDFIDLKALAGIPLEFVPWSAEREVENLRRMDVGIMPLLDDEWARAKCGLKALLYMSVGIPAVCSPVGVNNEIIRDGSNGFLASDEEAWRLKLARLLDDDDLRREMGRAARRTVEERYSLTVNFPKWREALDEILG